MTDLLAVDAVLPGGLVTAFVDRDGYLRAAGYGVAGEVAYRLLAGPLADLTWRPADGDAAVAEVAAAMAAYVAGDLRALDRVPCRQPGTALMQTVWLALRQLEPGEPATYSDLAAAAGAPRAIRPAASACARNRIAPFVPCHRVLRKGGAIGGYAYGIGAKEALLAHEALFAGLGAAASRNQESTVSA